MTPALIAIVLGTGLLALLPTRRLALRTEDRWIVVGYYLLLWTLVAVTIAVPPMRRLTLPLMLILAIAPWITLRAGLRRLFGLPPREGRRPPPRNVTPPDAR